MTENTAPMSFTDWTTENRDDIGWAAISYLDSFGLTGDMSRIVREHTVNVVDGYADEGLEFTEDDVESFVGDLMYEYETYDGPTRAALVHWAWNSDMDTSEYGPIKPDNLWNTIEHIAMRNVTSAGYAGLEYAVEGYAEYLEDFDEDDEDDEDTSGE